MVIYKFLTTTEISRHKTTSVHPAHPPPYIIALLFKQKNVADAESLIERVVYQRCLWR